MGATLIALGIGLIIFFRSPARSDLLAGGGGSESEKISAVKLKLLAENLTSPVALVYPDDQSRRLFVVDQIGKVFVIDADGQRVLEPFLDVRDRMISLNGVYDERGLLGMAFHPQYSRNRLFYVYYTAPLRQEAPAEYDSTSRLSEFRVDAQNPQRADPRSERILLEIDQPQSNHNGGPMVFGPEGYLYVGIGDGGAADDEGPGHNPETGNGQDTSSLLGKVLRIDVDGDKPYAIPADNPFVDQPGARGEIWAMGLRNPWGLSFDRGGEREFFVADVGQNLYEEVNIIQKGGNYGWRIREGRHCFDPASARRPPDDCPAVDGAGRKLLEPILEYPHHDPEGRIVGISVTGGAVYRGKRLTGMEGGYIFGDWSTSMLHPEGTLYVAFRRDGTWHMNMLRVAGENHGIGRYVLGFGQDWEGELYVLTSQTQGPLGSSGKVFKLVPAGQNVPAHKPDQG